MRELAPRPKHETAWRNSSHAAWPLHLGSSALETDAGGNVIDTASNYRGGSSGEIVGELLEGRRDRYVVATKFTVTRDGTDPNAADSQRKNLRLSLETSLRRLRSDYVDLHDPCASGRPLTSRQLE